MDCSGPIEWDTKKLVVKEETALGAALPAKHLQIHLGSSEERLPHTRGS